MKILFVHQNMPGQYREIVQWLARQQNHQIAFLTQREKPPAFKGVGTVIYKPHHTPEKKTYGLSRVWEQAARAGYGAALAARAMERDHNFKPDIVVGHAGWGELTFLKEIWPDVPIIGFFEYYYRLEGGIVGFDPLEPVSEHTPFLLKARNSVPLSNIEAVDQGQCPTLWQRDRFPTSFHDRMYVCHDGIRSDLLLPDPTVSLGLSRLSSPLARDDEVITYVTRNLEATRGFHILMRALPRILKERPKARIVILGGNDVSYGKRSAETGGLREKMENEVGADLDWSRVHFLGQVPYGSFKRIIQVSRCHIYLTMPFVLSWSMMEAMSMQATIVASDVPPVREMIAHGENGLLVDFHDPDALATQVIDVLKNTPDYDRLGVAAREFIVQKHDFMTCCLPEHLRQMNELLPSEKRVEIPG